MEEDDQIREATTSEKAHMVLGIVFGLVIGGVIAITVSVDDPASDPMLTFDRPGLYDRGFSVDLPESGASVDCSFSRRNEFQISKPVFLYNETDCSTTFTVDDGNVSVNSSSVDVLFKFRNLGEDFSMGYDFNDNSLVCNISEADSVDDGGDQYPVDCSVVDEDISESWNDANFTDFNVVERGQNAIADQSN